ncbi:GDP-L-fucose synthase [Ulvibacter sp. MAR_2010_11]|uniref:GDP-L-fucose synthase family protein n=1 Tax=Ulvibacter sp. MAR_2010_11 TaxID=1250229 RepID=UPI000C2B5AE0|nr:GDP-L-fucose synthase [Ulvibacter sp. MAR_2010_11]PKA82121.1 GDP-L-fucose synthase [Ulvibacter sp. MAR_2010_11]
MNKDAKIYVAGHRGLVGSAILRGLQKEGYTNLLTQTHKDLDLTNCEAVASFFASEKPLYVFLAAAKVGGIAANNTYRADFIYENLMIQNNVIHQSYMHGVTKLLFLGSTCIYPKNAPQPLREDYLLTDVLEYTNEPYAIAKIAGIKMCESYNLQYGTNFISAMPTNLYGPNDNFDLEKAHVLPALLRKIHLGKAWEEENWEAIRKDLNRLPIKGVDGNAPADDIERTLNSFGISKNKESVVVEIWGTGTPMREFLWVEDMAEACLFMMQHANFSDCISDQKEVRNTHVNIGTGSDSSIADLATLLKKTIGFKGKFEFNANKPDGTMRKVTDVSKINAMGWKAKVTLEDGVAKMYKWYLNQ